MEIIWKGGSGNFKGEKRGTWCSGADCTMILLQAERYDRISDAENHRTLEWDQRYVVMKCKGITKCRLIWWECSVYYYDKRTVITFVLEQIVLCDSVMRSWHWNLCVMHLPISMFIITIISSGQPTVTLSCQNLIVSVNT